MTTESKIKESEFFLQQIKNNYLSLDVEHFFSAFLNATCSIADHLLAEYNVEYKCIPFTEKLFLRDFEESAKRDNKKDALEFIRWYKAKRKEIESDTLNRILINKRHSNTHKESIRVKSLLEIMFKNMPDEYIKQVKIVNPNYDKPVFHTEEMAYVEVKDCEGLLTVMKDMVNEAYAKFPNETKNFEF